jgi:hypothetical protein
MMAVNQKEDKEKGCKYILSVKGWSINIKFNDEMYQQFFDDRKFEERISMTMTGKVISTTSKKCKAKMAATFEIKPNKD